MGLCYSSKRDMVIPESTDNAIWFGQVRPKVYQSDLWTVRKRPVRINPLLQVLS